MLQNGTCINKVRIDKPHRLITATTIATQIITAVTSSQYGGATITLTHLAPFVRDSYNRYKEKYKARGFNEDLCEQYANEDLKKEIGDAVQTFNYQVNSMTTSNGQAPFISVMMYLGETTEYKQELAMLIEEFLRQRIKGLKNEVGAYITPAFPKLLYVLEEDNIHEGSPYWYLTVLAAQCTVKRMVPDYISEKIMLELKGETYPCMGCVDGKEVITYQYNSNTYTESFERMWHRLSKYFEIKLQPNGKDLVMKTPGVLIYDQKKGFVNNYGIIKNHTSEWLCITFSNGRSIKCTPDHPFETVDRRIVLASELKESDLISIDKETNFKVESEYTMKLNRAWLYGFALCDSTYYDHFMASIAATGEDEIAEAFIHTINMEYGLPFEVIERQRGEKGCYKDLFVKTDNTSAFNRLRLELTNVFEGKAKADRHIPNEVFLWSKNAKLAFIAGMIDADGYLNTTSKKATIQIGSTNKELAIQQMLLAQTCGMFARVYLNHYKSNEKNKIRYRIEFTPTIELLNFIACKKKTNLFDSVLQNTNASITDETTCYMTHMEQIHEDGFSYDVTTESEHFTVSGIYSHNCRSFLTPDRFTDKGLWNIAKAGNDEPGKHKYYGRLNQGVVTLNLPDIALSSGGDMETFWQIFEERCELCHKALKARHERLEGTVSDVAPILWQDGAFARLGKGEVIDELLHHGYSTLSLGYAGLYECVKYMTGHSHTDGNIGETFGLEVMQALNDKCSQWKENEDIDYSLYGSPIESTTYKFAKCLKKRFGIVEGITDRDYITNSYHVPVFEEIDPFEKLSIESKFQKLSPGGAITYIECADMTHNIEAVLEVISFIYDNIMYAELNTKSDYCQVCGYDGEIKLIDENNELIWECPNCGNRDKTKMNVARRTCGLIQYGPRKNG